MIALEHWIRPPCASVRRELISPRTLAIQIHNQSLTMLISLSRAILFCGLAPLMAGAQQTAPVVQPGAPGEPSKTLPSSTTGHAPALAETDVEFMQGMIMHHSQAIEMTALIPTHSSNKQLALLGARISRSQSEEMKFMKRWLVARDKPTTMAMPGMPEMDMSGHAMPPMPGMLTAAQMQALAAANGKQFDKLFLEGMIQHHNGALIMVKQLFDTGGGQDADLFDFATDADNTQRAEIKIMQNMLKENR